MTPLPWGAWLRACESWSVPAGWAGLEEASACEKGPSTHSALVPTLASSPHEMEGRGAGEKDRGPSVEGGPCPSWHSPCFHHTL